VVVEWGFECENEVARDSSRTRKEWRSRRREWRTENKGGKKREGRGEGIYREKKGGRVTELAKLSHRKCR
jgi:hypothetical protein